MKAPPSLPPVAETEQLLTGHLWIVEDIVGLRLRFQLTATGLLQFGDSETMFDAKRVPLPYRRAVRTVSDSLDRETLRVAVSDVSQIVFFGVVPVAGTVTDDLDAMPAFLGTDVWDGTSEAFRPPDAAHGIFERLNLTPVNTFERELSARDFDPDTYQIPDSGWAETPAAGVIIKNKRGKRGRLTNPAVEPTIGAAAPEQSADSLAETAVTEARVSEIQQTLETTGEPATVDSVTDRILAQLGRRRPTLFLDGEITERELRSAVAQRVQPLVQR